MEIKYCLILKARSKTLLKTELQRVIKLQIATCNRCHLLRNSSRALPEGKAFPMLTYWQQYISQDEQQKGYLWTMVFPFRNSVAKALDTPLNAVCHWNLTTSVTAQSLSGQEGSENLQPLLQKDLCAFTLTHILRISHSRVIKLLGKQVHTIRSARE